MKVSTYTVKKTEVHPYNVIRSRLLVIALSLTLVAIPILAVYCSYTRSRSEFPYTNTAIAEIYGTSPSNSYGYARGQTATSVCVYSCSSIVCKPVQCSCRGEVSVYYGSGEAGSYIYSEAYWYFEPDFSAAVTAFLEGYCSC